MRTLCTLLRMPHSDTIPLVLCFVSVIRENFLTCISWGQLIYPHSGSISSSIDENGHHGGFFKHMLREQHQMAHVGGRRMLSVSYPCWDLLFLWSSSIFSPDCAILPGCLWRQIALSPYPSVEAVIGHIFMTWCTPILFYLVVAMEKSTSLSEAMLHAKVFGSQGWECNCTP